MCYVRQQASLVGTNQENENSTKAHALTWHGISNISTEALEIPHEYVSIFLIREKTLRQNDTTQSTAEARFLEKSKWWNLIRNDWDVNTVLKISSIMTESHYHVCPLTLTNKQDKQEKSICKAEGATSQILVANALKYSFFLQITLTFGKSSMQILQ